MVIELPDYYIWLVHLIFMFQVMHLTPDLNPATHHLIANEFLPDMPDEGLIFDPNNKTFSLSEFVSK